MNNDAGDADVMVPVPSLSMARCGCNHAEFGVGEVILGMSGNCTEPYPISTANLGSPRRESRSEINRARRLAQQGVGQQGGTGTRICAWVRRRPDTRGHSQKGARATRHTTGNRSPAIGDGG